MTKRALILGTLAVVGLALIGYRVLAQEKPESTPSSIEGESVEVPQPTEKAIRYHESGNILWVVAVLWTVAVPGFFFFSGGSARLRGYLERLSGNSWVIKVTWFAVTYTAFVWLMELPLRYYSGYVRPHAYDLSTRTLGKWAGDSVRSLVVSCILFGLVAWIPYLLMKKSPRRWWLWTGLAAFPLSAILLVVTPIWIDPLFNEFGPMKDKALERRILSLAERSGIEGSRIFEVEKSVETKTVNAYVTGFLGTRRIVLWDTIIDRLDEEELLFVMGHEIGHYVLGHVTHYVVLGPLGLLAGLFVLHAGSGMVFRRFGSRTGVTELSDVASLPLAMFILLAGGVVASPLIFAHSRSLEKEADRFGLELTQSNHAGASAFVALQEENLSVPDPSMFYRIFRGSHPSLGDRIRFCNQYRPWENGEPLRYGDRFSATTTQQSELDLDALDEERGHRKRITSPTRQRLGTR